jgi:hypothetical protein
MPAFVVSVNGTHLVTVSTKNRNIIHILVSGDLVAPEFSALEVSGGLYGEGSNSTHLIWVSGKELFPGDEIEVRMLEHADSSHPGQTIDELCPEGVQPICPEKTNDQILLELAQTPSLRECFSFSLLGPAGEEVDIRPASDCHGYGFSVTWNWKSPDQARVSLSSYSIRNLADDTDDEYHARFKLLAGQGILFCANALSIFDEGLGRQS